MRISVVAVKELREKLLTRTFAVGVILCSVLMPVSMGAMVRLYHARLLSHIKRADRERYDLRQTRSWNQLVWRGVTLDREPSPLLAFAVGVERNAQSRVRIESYWSHVAAVGAPTENPLLSTMGGLDYSAVVRVVLSLLTILLLHDSVSGEKEGGTLRLLLVAGAPRDTLILGKYLGGLLAATVPFLLGTLLGLMILVVYLPGAFGAEHLARGAVLFGVSLLYISAFALLSLFVSACFDRSSTALTALLLVWIVLVLVAPNASVLVARVAQKTKPDAQLAGEMRSLLDNARKTGMERWRKWRNLPDNRDLPWRERYVKQQEFIREAYEEASRKVQRIQSEYFRGMQRQTAMAMNLSRVSPASCLSHIAMNLARTDAERANEYVEAADRYREMARRVVEDMVAMESYEDMWGGDRYRKFGPIDVDLLPRFDFREADLLTTVVKSGPDLGLLAGVNILLLMLAHMAFLRYSPV